MTTDKMERMAENIAWKIYVECSEREVGEHVVEGIYDVGGALNKKELGIFEDMLRRELSELKYPDEECFYIGKCDWIKKSLDIELIRVRVDRWHGLVGIEAECVLERRYQYGTSEYDVSQITEEEYEKIVRDEILLVNN